MAEIPAEETPIYTELAKEYDNWEKINQYFGPHIYFNYWRDPKHAND